jgi:hypothetical protein
MREGIVWTFAFSRSQGDLLPITHFAKPLISRSSDITTTKESRPDEIDES